MEKVLWGGRGSRIQEDLSRESAPGENVEYAKLCLVQAARDSRTRIHRRDTATV